VRTKKLNLLAIFFIAFATSSCISYDESVLLQETTEGTYDVNSPITVHRIKANDILNINIKSLESSNIEFVNPQIQQNVQIAQQGTGSPQLLFNGYSIDESGRIDVPLIGHVNVLGLSLKEIEVILESKLEPYVKFSKITVSLSNFRVTVMGEVTKPGVQYIFEKDYDVLQAISNAGDLTDFANRRRVKVLRRESNKLKSVWLDLTTPEVVGSAHFYLQPGDYIYVEPLKAKVAKSNIQNASLGVSIVSLAVTLITLFSR